MRLGYMHRMTNFDESDKVAMHDIHPEHMDKHIFRQNMKDCDNRLRRSRRRYNVDLPD